MLRGYRFPGPEPATAQHSTQGAEPLGQRASFTFVVALTAPWKLIRRVYLPAVSFFGNFHFSVLVPAFAVTFRLALFFPFKVKVSLKG